MTDSIEFGLFDRAQETEITLGDLPHWFQPNVAVFITFRTIDSLPISAVKRMDAELRDWLTQKGHQVNSDTMLPDWKDLPLVLQAEYRLRRTKLLHWELDTCSGECVLKNPDLSKIVLDSLRHFNGTRYDLDSVVVMPNHVHVLAQFRPPFNCRDQCTSWMRFSARQIHRNLNRAGYFWQSEPFDHLVRSVEQFEYLRRYIRDNGPRARLNAAEFRYWDRTMT